MKRRREFSDFFCLSPKLFLSFKTPSNLPNPLKTSFYITPPQNMASREGINPLRPYYIPQSGLSPSTSSPEVSSPSSAQVFGSTARDLIPDLDYADYLDASPSVSEWVRDALNSALRKYTQVLVAQPFDVAKTILQVYVVPDVTEEEVLGRSSDTAGNSSYDSVRRFFSVLRYSKFIE